MRNRIYYTLKPFLPLSLRLALRRLRARHALREGAGWWPIYEPSGRMPEDWPGWPGGKKFAFVLTHDVEGIRGLSRCRKIAEIEMEHGFRSSFNFIPKGEYVVPADLLHWLRRNGFEIGVHDLRHDGTLFASRKSFERDAGAINRQLKEWGAVGFRAGFMLHELEWLHELNIEYDASTFDVDPFEPQPDGTQTVFPFWVQRPDPDEDAFRNGDGDGSRVEPSANGSKPRPGYIELPYTLVQDYNLFVVLQASGIDVWSQKLRWLAGKGAMALLDTHPDYMALPGDPRIRYEYPVQFYRNFLGHVRSVYADSYWHALPKEVAAYCRPLQPRQARPPRQVVMLSHSFYTGDNRVRRYAEALAKRGDEVRVLSLGNDEEVKSRRWATLRGVNYLCLQSRETLEGNKWEHGWRLLQFMVKAFKSLSPKNLPNGCDLLHVHNIPDFLVFAGARLKYRGARLILDIHDIVPELYESKYSSGRRSILAAGLRLIETLACRFANHVIIANHLWKKTIIARSSPAGKVTALVNNVDLELFAPRKGIRDIEGPILLYPGSLNRHQGVDLAIQALPELVGEFPGIQMRIHGRGPSLPELKELTAKLGLTERVLFLPAVPLDEVSGIMSASDIGIVPKRAEGFGDQAYSTKIMEFMSQRLPVIVSRTSIDSLYFNDSVVAFFESGNHKDLADKIRRVARDGEYRRSLSTNGYAYAQANSWETMKHVYLNLVDRLTMTSTNYPPQRAR